MQGNWARVAETVKRRRTGLGLSQRQAARLADDISPTTWQNLESRQQPVSALSAAAICKALRWRSDSIQLLLEGGDPVELPDPDDAQSEAGDELLAAVRDLTEVVRELRADLRRGRR